MIETLVLKRRRRRDPSGDGSTALMFCGLLAATGFAWGWIAQAVLGSL